MKTCQYIYWKSNNNRYYKVIIHKDLFNDLIVTCIWGGVGSRLGNYKHQVVNSISEAYEFIKSISHIRERRGYKIIHKNLFISL